MAGDITAYHAHIYYDAPTRPVAEAVRAGIAAAFPAARLGRWHDVPVGPHPQAMYQVAFAPDLLPALFPWLLLHRRGLTVLLHAETGDDLADHRDHATWMGAVLPLRLEALGGRTAGPVSRSRRRAKRGITMSESTRRRSDARRLAEQALRAQAAGHDAAAERLFAEAQQIDPDTVAAVLQEHDAGHEPDARDQRTFTRDRLDQHTEPPLSSGDG